MEDQKPKIVKTLIVANGEAHGDENSGVYTLRVEGLPSKERAQKFAVEMAKRVVDALNIVMGSPAGAVGSNDGDVLDGISGSGSAAVMAKNIEEFLEKMDAPPEVIASVRETIESVRAEFGEVDIAKDDCQCPGCRARRADEEREAQLKSGTSSEAKH